MKEMENAYTYTLEASKLSKYKILGMDFHGNDGSNNKHHH